MVLCDAEYARAIDRALFPGTQGGPLMHTIAAKAVAFAEAATPAFRSYCAQVIENARALADGLAERGHRIVAGGTDTHLFLLSLVGRELSGKAAQDVLEAAGITANKNMVPYDPRKPMVTSGVRIGTPAVTTRGMGVAEMKEVAGLVDRALEAAGDARALSSLRVEVEALCARHPLYADRWTDAD
jgi:glycine hydroxymethyltransferase